MYEERKDSFSIKGFILQLLIILLFVFLMLWLFPTKNYIKNNLSELQSEQQLQRLELLYGEIFANNVERMKDAAIGYYTDERLPQKIGEIKKITLGEMYEKHLVLKLSDIDGNSCSTTDSYVEVTKYENEYQFKVNLKCGDKEDYIIVYMGCYTYCDSGLCEKQVTTTPDKPKSPVYMYEYKLETDGSTVCTGWSEWTTNKIEGTSTVTVDTKTEKVQTGTKPEKYISGYKMEKVVVGTKQVQTGTTYKKEQTGTKTEKYISGYKTEKVVVDTKQVQTGMTTEKYISGYTTEKTITGVKKVQTGTTTKTTIEKVAAVTTLVYQKSDSGTTVPNNTTTTVYKKTGSTTKQSCSNCASKTYYTWDEYKVVTVYKTQEVKTEVPVYKLEYTYEEKQVPVYSTREVPVYKTENIYEEKEIPVYSLKEVPVYGLKEVPVYKTENVYEEKEVPVYSTREVPTYSDVKYYRSKTCTIVEGGTYYKWSTSKNDSALIDQGYVLTGNVKEI